jgi:hypothetical protein
MAEENREQQREERNTRSSEAVEEQGGGMEFTNPVVRDAANTVTQPTSYRLPVHMQVRGEMPGDRFTEEVVKGSDEDTGEGWETHPEENQPVPGIGPDDELPDTTGRAALREQKRDR